MANRSLQRFLFLVFSIMVFVLASFGLVTVLDVKTLDNPGWIYSLPYWAAFLSSVGLLMLDVLIPVPASLVMIANGALFGVVGGSVVSVVGALMSVLFGWYVGRAASGKLNRYVGEEGLASARAFMDKWGSLAVIISRPIPVISETVTLICGTIGYPLGRMAWMGILGSAPAAVIFAYAGAEARDAGSGLLSFFIVIGVSLVVWLLGRFLKKISPVK